jgi:hypothetical protein
MTNALYDIFKDRQAGHIMHATDWQNFTSDAYCQFSTEISG